METNNDQDDANWKLGFLYYNPNDSRVMVSKRFGFGWTFNFANVWSYVLLLALIGIIFLVRYYIHHS